jgi:hypothetical protein
MSRIPLLAALTAIFGLVSCATVGKVGSGSLAFMQKTTAKVSKLTEMAVDKIHPPGVKVVEVREKDLKKLPSGHERALAYENTRSHGFWFFNGPVDFKEPTLPLPGGEMDGSLLPPKGP